MNETSAVALATRTYGDSVNFVGVVVEHEAEESGRLLPTFGLGEVPNIIDDGTVWREFGVPSQPAMVFVEADGSWNLNLGELGPWDLQDRIDEMLAAA